MVVCTQTSVVMPARMMLRTPLTCRMRSRSGWVGGWVAGYVRRQSRVARGCDAAARPTGTPHTRTHARAPRHPRPRRTRGVKAALAGLVDDGLALHGRQLWDDLPPRLPARQHASARPLGANPGADGLGAEELVGREVAAGWVGGWGRGGDGVKGSATLGRPRDPAGGARAQRLPCAHTPHVGAVALPRVDDMVAQLPAGGQHAPGRRGAGGPRTPAAAG